MPRFRSPVMRMGVAAVMDRNLPQHERAWLLALLLMVSALLLTSGGAWAQDVPPKPAGDASAEQAKPDAPAAPEAPAQPDSPAVPEAARPAPPPADFRPTESVQPGSSVSFPVDI